MRSHIGTVDNKRRDVLAKEACLKDNIDYSFHQLKGIFRRDYRLYILINGKSYGTIRKKVKMDMEFGP